VNAGVPRPTALSARVGYFLPKQSNNIFCPSSHRSGQVGLGHKPASLGTCLKPRRRLSAYPIASLNESIGSIVPSGHSASTCHRSPSLSTTQKMGFRAVILAHSLSAHVFSNAMSSGSHSTINPSHFRSGQLSKGTPRRNEFARLGPEARSRDRCLTASGAVSPSNIGARAAQRLHYDRGLALHAWGGVGRLFHSTSANVAQPVPVSDMKLLRQFCQF
jgi:hypothetical protein